MSRAKNLSRRHPHLLRVEAPPAAHATLIDAARSAGLRIGWLDLGSQGSGSSGSRADNEGGEGGEQLEAPADLLAATRAGALRAVAVVAETSVAVKARAGPPILRDLLREHFAGCALVLVRGQVDAPLLEADGDGWRVRGVDDGRRLSTVELVSRLRRPRLG